jgi:integrase/recombinase XerC/integrase/recombinase XerD
MQDAVQLPLARPESLSLLLEGWLQSCAARGKSPRTVRWYRPRLTEFIAWYGRSRSEPTTEDFTVATVEAFLAALRQRHKWESHPTTPTSPELVSGGYVDGFVRAFRAFASWLYEQGYTAENRLGRFRHRPAKPPIIEPLSTDQIRSVIEAACSLRDRALIITMVDTGLRASEVLTLKMSDARIEDTTGTLLVMGKGGRQRIVPIDAHTQRVLVQYKRKERPTPVHPSVEEFFLTRAGEPMTAATLKLVFDRLRDRTGLKKFHPHLLRHTFATHYLENGGDLFSLQLILGHSSLEMVRRYSHMATGQVLARHKLYSPVAAMKLWSARRPTAG